MNTIIILLLFILSYLVGSFPSGYVLAKKIKKIDIRKTGSNSTGATNTTRVLGAKYGMLALLMDAFKGIIVMLILVVFDLKELYVVNIFNDLTNILPVYGLFAVLGHVFPIFLGFKGGKAVATSFGVVLFLTPLLTVIGIFIFVLIVKLTKYVSLASITTAFSIFIVSLIFAIFNVVIMKYMATPKLVTIPIEYAVIYGVLSTIIILKHKDNIVRLLSGEENKFILKK